MVNMFKKFVFELGLFLFGEHVGWFTKRNGRYVEIRGIEYKGAVHKAVENSVKDLSLDSDPYETVHYRNVPTVEE